MKPMHLDDGVHLEKVVVLVSAPRPGLGARTIGGSEQRARHRPQQFTTPENAHKIFCMYFAVFYKYCRLLVNIEIALYVTCRNGHATKQYAKWRNVIVVYR